MSSRDRYEPGVPCWVDTAQPDVDAALHFYGELFGWEFAGPAEMPGEPPGRYYVARLRGRDVAGISTLPPDAPEGPPAWSTHISVASADQAAAAAAQAGGTVLAAPFDAPPAGRLAVLADPAGAVSCVWEAGTRQGAQLVNEPSAWAMSRLDTPDPAAAGRFYGSVFGWESEALRFGEAEAMLWRLPGYLGGEPQQPVPRDVVAAMMAADAGSPARWSVDFWIADADAAAQTATRLGGTVPAGPFEVPGFRTAVLQDPQGASFSVSQLLL